MKNAKLHQLVIDACNLIPSPPAMAALTPLSNNKPKSSLECFLKPCHYKFRKFIVGFSLP
jgi:hypothetical protein